MELKTGVDDEGRRLDRVLRKALPEAPLSLIHRLLRQGQVLVNGRPGEPSFRVRAGDTIAFPGSPPPSSPRPPLPRPSARPAPGRPSLSADLLWQGAGLLVFNKPAGLAVHGPGSLDTELREALAGRLAPSLSFRPGPLHRLDKPTSGVIVFSGSLEGARFFSALLREGRVKKYYLALVEGIVEGPEIWEDSLVRDGAAGKTLIAEGPGCPRPVPAGGGNGCKGETPDAGGAFIGRAKPQRALTRVSPLKSLAAEKQGGGGASFPAGFSLILAEIETGRTHQIRAQAAARGHPLAGDKKYGGHYQPGGFLLHAWKLEFPDTPGRGLPRSITAPPPENFRARIRELFGEEI